jgi:hypothetical protein
LCQYLTVHHFLCQYLYSSPFFVPVPILFTIFCANTWLMFTISCANTW